MMWSFYRSKYLLWLWESTSYMNGWEQLSDFISYILLALVESRNKKPLSFSCEILTTLYVYIMYSSRKFDNRSEKYHYLVIRIFECSIQLKIVFMDMRFTFHETVNYFCINNTLGLHIVSPLFIAYSHSVRHTLICFIYCFSIFYIVRHSMRATKSMNQMENWYIKWEQ